MLGCQGSAADVFAVKLGLDQHLGRDLDAVIRYHII
jgi:hypothetical protein